MVNLKRLTVPYLEKLAEELKITFKSSSNKPDKIRVIKNTGIPDNKLNELVNKYYAQYQVSRGKLSETKKKPTKHPTFLEDRIKLLEGQTKFIMSKIDEINVKLANLSSTDSSINTHDIQDIKNIIKSRILPGKSITVDELLRINRLNKFTKDLIYTAVIDLVDEEIFDVSEGNSKNKIQGYIGRLIRR